MKHDALRRRITALETARVPLIDNLAKFVVWHAKGCNPAVRWDPHFKEQIENFVITSRKNRK